MDESKKHHHFLINGMIMFVNNKTQDIGSVLLNGVLIQEERDLPQRSLGKAQQILQYNFHQKTSGDTEITVVDVVLNNFVHLGEFTKEEFHQPPEGLTLKEATAAVAEVVNQDKPVLSVVNNDDSRTSH